MYDNYTYAAPLLKALNGAAHSQVKTAPKQVHYSIYCRVFFQEFFSRSCWTTQTGQKNPRTRSNIVSFDIFLLANKERYKEDRACPPCCLWNQTAELETQSVPCSTVFPNVCPRHQAAKRLQRCRPRFSQKTFSH